jgi:hypothetical protein
MSNTKHTPAPWRIYKYKTGTGKQQTIIQTERANVCRMDIAGRDEQTLEGDATLIAAAPDLLKACQQAHEWVSAIIQHSPFQFGGEVEIGELLKSAIEKARGER